ncbi:cytochrome c oxidase subunit 4 [Demequina globuliformis]|uniref:cytochrome c oxidase subunit 4 n=1 Tax=Demequina globuliformis TaxID=676202 RepID=UPI0007809C73|nr:cytochrome c oxidase subunit 4 [Demequina globuliformis]
MRLEANIFALPSIFFLGAALVYGFLTEWTEWVGFTGILLTFGMFIMVGVYFKMLQKRHGARPEDREDGDIAELSGEQGFYAPWSWWPIVLAAGAALAFVALAVGWWILVPATVVGVIGLVGWVMEFSTGRHAH